MIKEVTYDYLKNNTNLLDNYRGIIRPKFTRFLLLDNNALLIYSLIYDRMELDYIFVSEKFRRQKLASKLLEQLIKIANNQKCVNISLEVKIDNLKAINLYEKYNFETKAIRKNYYGKKDGLLMIKELGDQDE